MARGTCALTYVVETVCLARMFRGLERFARSVGISEAVSVVGIVPGNDRETSFHTQRDSILSLDAGR